MLPHALFARRPAFVLFLALCFAAPAFVAAQDLHPSRRPSPTGIAKTHLGETYVKVVYSRPYVRGRAIFGADDAGETYLVPFGKLWRTGANEATELTTTGPLLVGGKRLEAGTYALFTEPGPSEWVVHFSPQLGLDGTGRLDADGTFTPNVYDPAQDVLAVTASVHPMEEMVDQFTISFEPFPDGADLTLRWEKTEVRLPVVPASEMGGE
jgi:hypothetical protein